MPDDVTEVEVEGRLLRLSNLAKTLYPADGTPKAAVVRYYVAVAPAILPHLRGRPLTMVRWPDGVGAERFYAKRVPPGAPAWVARAPGPGDEVQVLAEDASTLVWLANLAALELHVPLWRLPERDRPTWAILDLDPGPPAGLADCCRIALHVRDVLDAAGLVAAPKVSGSKGLHLHVPLGGTATNAQARSFARAVASVMAQRHPTEVVSHQAKADRTNRVLVDWNQNDPTRTNACTWSLRGTPTPRAAVPVGWDEVEAAAGRGDAPSLTFDPDAALERAAAGLDSLLAIEGRRQALPGV